MKPPLRANWKGFIVVLNGSGVIEWSHVFFGATAEGDCAVTDVSIRVDGDLDVVTYCGISTHGNPAANLQLTVVRPFDAPTNPQFPNACLGNTRSGGASATSPGQWDGFVGRLTNNHDMPIVNGLSGSAPVFHSMVGGDLQDGLFGIDEITADRFVVVGSTGLLNPGQPGGTAIGTSGFTFPFTTPVCANQPNQDYALGVFLVFNAAGAGPIGVEVIREVGSDPATGDQQCPAGTVARPRFTIARDVVVKRATWDQWGQEMVVVCGSTDDCDLLNASGVAFANPQVAPGGGADGFVMAFTAGQIGWTPWWGTFRGGAGQDGLTGVQAWNEHIDHFAVTGFVDAQETPGANMDVDVGSYYVDVGPINPRFVGLRDARVGGALADAPTTPGALRSTTVAVGPGPFNGLTFTPFDLGDPAGGGITVDPRGRLNVVGSTASLDFPNTAAPPASRDNQSPLDAVRAVVDMLPAGVGRTDGTGAPVPGGVAQYPPPGFTGGTTPECALTMQGARITEPAPALLRILIDYEGPPPGNVLPPISAQVSPVILLDRLPPASVFQLIALQVDFPGGPTFLPVPDPLGSGVLIWTVNATTVFFAPNGGGAGNANNTNPTVGRTLRFQLDPLPAFNLTFTVQAFALLGLPIPGGNLGPVCANPQGSTIAASPALWISY